MRSKHLSIGALATIGVLLLVSYAGAPSATSQEVEGDLNRGAVVSGLGTANLIIPPVDPENGRRLYGSKGCVVCHSINDIGGDEARPLDADTMPIRIDPFDFMAKMWRGAQDMITLQMELGGQIEFDGQEIADIVAFIHSAEEQELFSEDDVPRNIRRLYE